MFLIINVHSYKTSSCLLYSFRNVKKFPKNKSGIYAVINPFNQLRKTTVLNLSDKELWSKLKMGDQAALKEIYDREYDHIYNYGKTFTRDEVLVEDSIHDLFVEIWSRKENLSETNCIRPYLMISLKRKIIRQSQKSHKTVLKEDVSDLTMDTSVSEEDRLIELETIDAQSTQLKQCFDELPHRQREVLYLKYYSSMDNESIATNMGISNQSVRNLAHKAISTLREKYNFFIVSIGYILSQLFL